MTRPDLSALTGQQLYWEDLTEGDAFDSPTRTITEADVTGFACLSGDFNRLHVDAEYAAGSAYGQRIAHGLLVVSVMSGLTTRMLMNNFLEPSLLGLLDMQCRFPKPTFIGDTIGVRVTVTEKRETSKPERGILSFRREVINQRGETVVEGIWKLLVRRAPQGA
ncbi:MaoC family dehydratase [Salipiger aestuarii]|uniref:MaoC family dehydratase n=1 Tax=Salipiger aestuarii TaxID=568098 RepID=UPI0012392316|nr:MaoC/PaaZ C-terminal domain-containing protein [Salipiger aestuarii]KAA8612180.1 acyl dehydratase [Salipiger aestuarii]